MAAIEECLRDWAEAEKDYAALEDNHKTYCRRVEDVKAVQRKTMSEIAHQRYNLKKLSEAIKALPAAEDDETTKKIQKIREGITLRKNQFRDMEEVLPHENGIYLTVILGSVNVSLLSKHDKYKYKENYESFKLYVTIIAVLVAILLWFITSYRVLDAAFQFLLVWYYCTLTIREQILKVNGSRIKGWWITHHFVSTASSGILLIWPDGYTYDQFRMQFVVFSIYISIVQIIQCYYQKGSLYRLRSLGERHNMDITVEGFQSWMWRGLTFVLPFLVAGYIFQLYNAYVLFMLALDERCVEWQVLVLAILFLTIFLGNSLTTVAVIRQKMRKSGWMKHLEYILKNKYQFDPFAMMNNSNKVHQS